MLENTNNLHKNCVSEQHSVSNQIYILLVTYFSISHPQKCTIVYKIGVIYVVLSTQIIIVLEK